MRYLLHISLYASLLVARIQQPRVHLHWARAYYILGFRNSLWRASSMRRSACVSREAFQGSTGYKGQRHLYLCTQARQPSSRPQACRGWETRCTRSSAK